MMAPETVVTVEHNKPNSQPQQQQQGQGALDWMKIDVAYFKTLPGILKLLQLILGILCMSLPSPTYWGGSGWFCFVAVTSFITTLMWSFVYLLSVREALRLPINWLMSELISTGVETVLYFIGFIVQFAASSRLAHTSVYGSNVAAAVFGMFNTAAYAASTFLLYKENRETQGPR